MSEDSKIPIDSSYFYIISAIKSFFFLENDLTKKEKFVGKLMEILADEGFGAKLKKELYEVRTRILPSTSQGQ